MKYIKLGRYKKHTTKVSDADVGTLSRYSWCFDGRYAYRRETQNGKCKKIYLHRQIMGFPRRGMDVDHINGDKLDNRRENLRVVSRSANELNKPKMQGKTSKYKGVHWHKHTSKWKVETKRNGEKYYIGVFDCEKEAAAAYNRKILELHGNIARLNKL